MANEKSVMQTIREGLTVPHRPGDADTSFADAIYELFAEFKDDFSDEWERIDDNEQMYKGNHWEGAEEQIAESKSNFPKPSTPIITSTIENIKADLSDEFPEAVFLPDAHGSEKVAKILTRVIGQELDVCGWEREYDLLAQDFLNCGWAPLEIGYDPFLNGGMGGSYIRYVVNKNFLCDPQCADIQDGRAIFKFEKKPVDWFVQHYPEHAEYMEGDDDLIPQDHGEFGATTAPAENNAYWLIEAWFRVYDPEKKKHAVHMVQLAGGQVLTNSYEEKPEGYFKHGMYPFKIARLFPQKGSALGIGITDLFKDPQRYSDKLDQILLVNAYRASRPRLLIQDGVVDIDDFKDFSKEAIVVQGVPSAVAQWQETQPLPSHLMAYVQSIRESIKTESGSNDQSRGQTASGVTAASAITALQEMSTKRSRMEARALAFEFREAVRMQVDILREFATVPRKVAVTIDGKQSVETFDRGSLVKLLKDGTELPIEYYIDIRSARQTRYAKLAHNELWLEMMRTFAGTVDPVIMLEGLESEEKETLLDNIRRAQRGGMLALQRENEQLKQMLAQLQDQMSGYEDVVAQSQGIIARDLEALQQSASPTGATADSSMAQQTTAAPPTLQEATAAQQSIAPDAMAAMME